MKKLLLLLLFPLLVMSCQLEEEKEDPYATPSMGSASDLEATGATSFPTTSSEALDLFNGAQGAVTSTISSYGTYASLLNTEDIKNAIKASNSRFKDSETQNLDMDYNGIKATGSSTISVWADDTLYDTGTGTYDPAISLSYENKVNVTVDTNSLSDYPYTYTIKGKGVDNSFVKYTESGTYSGGNLVTASKYNVAFKIASGYAFSVKRDDGLGAKFILEASVDFSKAYTSEDDFDLNFDDDLYDAISAMNLVVKVYNDNNEEILSVDAANVIE